MTTSAGWQASAHVSFRDDARLAPERAADSLGGVLTSVEADRSYGLEGRSKVLRATWSE